MTNEPCSIAYDTASEIAARTDAAVEAGARRFMFREYIEEQARSIQKAIDTATAELRQENSVIRQANADANKLIEAAANEATKLNDQWRTKWEASCETLGNAIEREHAKDARISELEAKLEQGHALASRKWVSRAQYEELKQRNKEIAKLLNNGSGLCNCSCAELCPLGKVGMSLRCTAHELRRALVALKENK